MPAPLRILHLEDDSGDAALVAATLASEHLVCDITRAATRAQFVAALDERFDLILADFALPGFDGITGQRLARQRWPDVPFVFVSGTIGEEVAIERLKEGATDYVLKQRLQRLPSAVRRALAEAHNQRERRAAEAAVRDLNAELEARVEDRTAQLKTAHEEARLAKLEADRANRAKSEFLFRMSHDLRTPLNAVLGFAQLLETDALSASQQEAVSQILTGGRHLLDLINEVLDIARIEAGQLSLSPEPVAAAEVIHQVVDLLRPLGLPHGVAVTAEIDPAAALFVRADRQRLKQILLNLLGNAVKYNSNGGSVRVNCTLKSPGRVTISVADTGAGIPEHKLRLLFQPFERLSAGLSTIEGTGLGLAVSKALTEAMGGTIGVRSDVGRGTTFWVELPQTHPDHRDVRRREPVAVLAAHAASSGTILYVEDNPANIKLMERILARRDGARLLTAGSGTLGIAIAREQRPDLIFLDLHLPDMPGEDVLRLLWADESTRQVPVAVLSADAMPSQAQRMLSAGAIAYLTKPLDIARVLRLVDERLGHASAVSRKQTA